jgi:hypothetical protein
MVAISVRTSNTTARRCAGLRDHRAGRLDNALAATQALFRSGSNCRNCKELQETSNNRRVTGDFLQL